MSALFRTKAVSDIVAEIESGGSGLKRTLGALDLVMLGIGAVIGAGIFSAIGTAATGEVAADGAVVRCGAGPALMVSFILLGAVCALAGLCYAELTAMIPISGSAYTYAYATLGELVAWIIGWDLILEYAIGNIAVAIAWSGYFSRSCASSGSTSLSGSRTSYRDVALSSLFPGASCREAAQRLSATGSRSTCRGWWSCAITWVLVIRHQGGATPGQRGWS